MDTVQHRTDGALKCPPVCNHCRSGIVSRPGPTQPSSRCMIAKLYTVMASASANSCLMHAGHMTCSEASRELTPSDCAIKSRFCGSLHAQPSDVAAAVGAVPDHLAQMQALHLRECCRTIFKGSTGTRLHRRSSPLRAAMMLCISSSFFDKGVNK